MAERQNLMGKMSEHEISGNGGPSEAGAKNNKTKLMIIAVIFVLWAMILASLFYAFINKPLAMKEKVVLSTDTPHKYGYPDESISYNFSIYNPEEEIDIYSTNISGLPSNWTISLPDNIFAEGHKYNQGEFSIIPSPDSAWNRTYLFIFNVTSRNTNHTYTLRYKLTVRRTYGIELVCYNDTHDADPGRSTQYTIVIKNTGNGNETITLSYNESQLPHNWNVSFEFDSIDIPILSSAVVICNITTYENTSKGKYYIDIIATSLSNISDTVRVNTSLFKDFEDKKVKIGDKIQVNYIGFFPDGLIIDTSLEEIAKNDNYSKSQDFSIRPYYTPLKMYVGEPDPDSFDEYVQVIEGFWEGVLGLKKNDTTVVRIPPEKAYTRPSLEEHPLYGITPIFEITVVSIDD